MTTFTLFTTLFFEKWQKYGLDLLNSPNWPKFIYHIDYFFNTELLLEQKFIQDFTLLNILTSFTYIHLKITVIKFNIVYLIEQFYHIYQFWVRNMELILNSLTNFTILTKIQLQLFTTLTIFEIIYILGWPYWVKIYLLYCLLTILTKYWLYWLLMMNSIR